MADFVKKILARMNDLFAYKRCMAFFYLERGASKRLSRDLESNFIIVIIDDLIKLEKLSIKKNSLSGKVSVELLKGATVVVVLLDNAIVHFSCIDNDSVYIKEIESYILPKNGCAYIYNCYTDVNYRGLGLYDFTLRYILDNFDYGGFYICSLVNNYASLKVIESMGFNNFGFVLFERNIIKDDFLVVYGVKDILC